MGSSHGRTRLLVCAAIALLLGGSGAAQLVDRTLAPNNAGEGIALSLAEQTGAGRGDLTLPESSWFIINRDPFRAIRRGRQLFQRKFTRVAGQGPGIGDGEGDVGRDRVIGAGLADSCAACHGRPRGSAGFGGDVATRPDSRDAPHLFGLGLKEMLADEMTSVLRAARDAAVADAVRMGRDVRRPLVAKGIRFGQIVGRADGSADSSMVEGVDADLRVRPFFAHGGTISIREFVVGAMNAEMGLQVADPELSVAAAGARVVTPAGMVLDGALDDIEEPPSGVSEINPALVDYFEFYLLNYFKPALGQQTARTGRGRELLRTIGCTQCHVPELAIERDRRVADVETVFDPGRGHINRLFSTAQALFAETVDSPALPSLKRPRLGRFVVGNIYTDFKRHDLGPAFYEREYDGTVRQAFLTTPLWGVGTTPPYGHDGRSINLTEVILRHGGEAERERNAFASLPAAGQEAILAFLNSLVLFPPDDTASNLDPGDASVPGYPQWGHGSIRLGVLFNDPSRPE